MSGAHLLGWDAVNEQWVRCVVNADGKLIINPTAIFENPPTEDESKKAPTSEWAFDHAADVDAHHAPTVAGDLDHNDLANISVDDHHAKYTDAESRAAINDIYNADGEAIRYHDFNRYNCHDVEQFVLSGIQDGVARGYLWYVGASKQWNMYGKDAAGTLVQTFIRIYNGSTYDIVIHEGNFQAELDDYLEESPTNGVINKAPTSNWAFDHDADASAHHAKYTDAEALAAPANNSLTLTSGTYRDQTIAGKAIVYLNPGAGNIILEGFDDGTEGQILEFLRISGSNTVQIVNQSAHGDTQEKIYTKSLADETSAAGQRGGFRMIRNGGNWHVDFTIT